jgi:hypothetical protein
MFNKSIKYTLLGMAALAIATMPIQAADKPEKAEGKAHKESAEPSKGDKANRVIPFRGTLSAKTDTSITVGSRTFELNSETKVMKDGKPGTLADGEVGKPVAGSYRDQDGKLVAKMIRFGTKPEAEAGGKPEKAPKKEKKTE